MPLAALIGGISGGFLIDAFGRRKTIMGIAVPFFVGWILIATASNVIMVFAGRVFCGICVGVGSLAFPVYLGETVQPEVRGTLGLLPTAFGNTGILLAYFIGSYLSWSELAFFGAALPVPFFLLMIIAPETPRWYVTKKRVEDAEKSLQYLRGKNTDIVMEMRALTRSQAEAERTGGNVFMQMLNRKYVPAILITLGLMLFQQLSGINAVIFYAATIFKDAGGSIDENLSTTIIGVVNFVSTFIATAIVDRLGRKLLLYVSSVSMITTLSALGGYFYVKEATDIDMSDYSWLPLTCLVIYVLGFSMGFGPVPWLMLGEILPSKIRGTAASVATGFNWMCVFMVTKTFHSIIATINMYGTWWLFAVVCTLGLFFVIFFVPETRGKSLEEIEKHLTGGSKRIRNVDSKSMQNGC